jgi:hypothetical protein
MFSEMTQNQARERSSHAAADLAADGAARTTEATLAELLAESKRLRAASNQLRDQLSVLTHQIEQILDPPKDAAPGPLRH